MPKMKTHSGAKKRFSFTGTGKLKRRRTGLQHILTKKTKKRKRLAGMNAEVSSGEVKRVKRMLVK